MPSVVHFKSILRDWLPICGAPVDPNQLRSTIVAEQVTCPECLEIIGRRIRGGLDDATAREAGTHGEIGGGGERHLRPHRRVE